MHGYVRAPSPSVELPHGGLRYVECLWTLRGFVASSDLPITPDLMRSWCDDTGVWLSRRERAILYVMDRAFREQYPKTVAYHDARKARIDKLGSK